MKTLLIDGDILAYRAAAQGEIRVDWDGDGDVVRHSPDFSTVMESCDKAIREWKKELQADAVIVCLSCPTSEGWRRDVLPSYKMNRAGNMRPEHLQTAKDYLTSAYQTELWDRLEADDVMGIMSTDAKKIGQMIIVSEDKDMKTIPGWLFNPSNDYTPKFISEDRANQFHMLQTLTGDAVDGYKGAPGIGPMKALAALEPATTPAERWAAVVDCYWKAMAKKQGSPIPLHEAEAAALVQARVARILHKSDYSYSTEKVTLWNPSV
jgi:5'-3' exonuclease